MTHFNQKIYNTLAFSRDFVDAEYKKKNLVCNPCVHPDCSTIPNFILILKHAIDIICANLFNHFGNTSPVQTGEGRPGKLRPISVYDNSNRPQRIYANYQTTPHYSGYHTY